MNVAEYFLVSNEMYQVYLSIFIIHYVMALSIFAGQGGAVIITHPVNTKGFIQSDIVFEIAICVNVF